MGPQWKFNFGFECQVYKSFSIFNFQLARTEHLSWRPSLFQAPQQVTFIISWVESVMPINNDSSGDEFI